MTRPSVRAALLAAGAFILGAALFAPLPGPRTLTLVFGRSNVAAAAPAGPCALDAGSAARVDQTSDGAFVVDWTGSRLPYATVAEAKAARDQAVKDYRLFCPHTAAAPAPAGWTRWRTGQLLVVRGSIVAIVAIGGRGEPEFSVSVLGIQNGQYLRAEDAMSEAIREVRDEAGEAKAADRPAYPPAASQFSDPSRLSPHPARRSSADAAPQAGGRPAPA